MEPWRWHLQTCKHLVTVMAGDTPELARRWRRLREVSGTGSLIARRQEPVAEEVKEVTTHKSRLCHHPQRSCGSPAGSTTGSGGCGAEAQLHTAVHNCSSRTTRGKADWSQVKPHHSSLSYLIPG